jgi:release factor glutamine methyltransferase
VSTPPPSGPPEDPATVGDWLTWGAKRLAAAGNDMARWEARHLLATATGIAEAATRGRPEALLADPGPYPDWIAARAAGVPPSRLTGATSFRGLDLAVGPDTLDPRGDSETLVEAVLDAWPPARPGRLVDIGTGTGCLAIAVLLDRPALEGIATDLSAGALKIARSNAAAHGLGPRLGFSRGGWTAFLADASVDILISNPPYIRAAEIPNLDPSVRDYDPVLALNGGEDGLDAYRARIADAPRVARSGGLVGLEIGWDQGAAVMSLARAAGLADIRVVRDLGGRDRAVLAQIP